MWSQNILISCKNLTTESSALVLAIYVLSLECIILVENAFCTWFLVFEYSTWPPEVVFANSHSQPWQAMWCAHFLHYETQKTDLSTVVLFNFAGHSLSNMVQASARTYCFAIPCKNLLDIGFVLYLSTPFNQSLCKLLCYAPYTSYGIVYSTKMSVTHYLHQSTTKTHI